MENRFVECIKKGDKVAWNVAWNVNYGQVIDKRGLLVKELIVCLPNGEIKVVPRRSCIKISEEQFERLAERKYRDGEDKRREYKDKLHRIFNGEP